jgi:branched-chain amino acid transport system substrate-binding protein
MGGGLFFLILSVMRFILMADGLVAPERRAGGRQPVNMLKPVSMLSLLLAVLCLLPSCLKEKKTRIAIMTKLEAGSIVGSSEINAARLFIDQRGINNIEIVPVNDNWDPEQSRAALEDIIRQGIQLLITSHTSTCALAIMDRINSAPVLTFVTGATTGMLTGKDDFIFRNVLDVGSEQERIAEYINRLPGRSLLVIRDVKNIGYTEPALVFLKKYLRKEVCSVLDVKVDALDLQSLQAQIAGLACDEAYLLIGGYQSLAAGAIAQAVKRRFPGATIVLTPWVKSPELIEAAGGALRDCVLPSHYPPKGQSRAIAHYIETFHARYGYSPTFISINVYIALSILSEAIDAGARTPVEIKRYIMEKKTFPNEFLDVRFDEFGDVAIPLYFVTDIAREF